MLSVLDMHVSNMSDNHFQIVGHLVTEKNINCKICFLAEYSYYRQTSFAYVTKTIFMNIYADKVACSWKRLLIQKTSQHCVAYDELTFKDYFTRHFYYLTYLLIQQEYMCSFYLYTGKVVR